MMILPIPIGYIITILGTWILQDALASIAFYPEESWRWNHAMRLVRAIMGAVLLIFGWLLLIGR